MRCENGKIWCVDGENAVQKWRKCGVFSACTCLIFCILVSNLAVGWCGNCGLVEWLRGFRVWFLYDCGANGAFGNL